MKHMTRVIVNWPIHLVSVANSKETPLAQSGRRAKQRYGILHRLANALRLAPRLKAPYAVKLVRIGPRTLDEHDNLRHAFKNIADGVCDALGIKNDMDRLKIVFEYAQERSKAHAIRVEVVGEQE